MHKLNFKNIALLVLLAIVVTACGEGAEETPGISDAERAKIKAVEIAATDVAKTEAAVALLPTDVPAEATPTVTTQGDASPEESSETLTPLPTLLASATFLPTPFRTSTPLPAGSTPCYRANFEYETIPDGTRIPKNKLFVKLWRLKNTGTCTWTPAFSLRHVEGDLLGASSSVQLTKVDIPPGGFVEIEVDMLTPAEPGAYRGNWMLLSPDGVLFGVGIDGLGWIWIDIVVFIPDGF